MSRAPVESRGRQLLDRHGHFYWAVATTARRGRPFRWKRAAQIEAALRTRLGRDRWEVERVRRRDSADL